ncbi:MAG: SUMF1/EgtB/PvdO family nonheme iron enzyme, partial [Thermodesulfobacteriota bacterium]
LDNERPQSLIDLPPFLIDRFPVTNGEFLRFVRAGGYHNPSWWTPEGWQWREQSRVEHPLYWRQTPGGEWTEIGLTPARLLPLDHPVSNVSWYEADAYARFAGKRLPTEAEWEKAAVWDPDRNRKLPYPWGEEQPDGHHCNFNATVGGTTAVGRYAEYQSPYGCADTLGNVWEWTSSWFRPYPGFAAYPYEGYSVPYFDQQHRVLRGGSWATRRHVLRPSFRNWYHPWVREVFAGFRCAKDV